MSDDMQPQFMDIDGRRYVKVRIPVSVNASGEWLADGFHTRRAKLAMDACEESAAECGLGNVRTVLVYALVPVPCRGEVVHGSTRDE